MLFRSNKSANVGALIFIVTLFGSALIIAYHPPFVQRFLNAKQRNQDPGMDAIIARMMNVTKRGTTLSTNQKYFVLLATCAAQGLSEEAEDVTAAALKAGVEPIVIKEAVYQTAPYVGVGRVKEALEGVNEALKDAGVRLPLDRKSVV